MDLFIYRMLEGCKIEIRTGEAHHTQTHGGKKCSTGPFCDLLVASGWREGLFSVWTGGFLPFPRLSTTFSSSHSGDFLPSSSSRQLSVGKPNSDFNLPSSPSCSARQGGDSWPLLMYYAYGARKSNAYSPSPLTIKYSLLPINPVPLLASDYFRPKNFSGSVRRKNNILMRNGKF